VVRLWVEEECPRSALEIKSMASSVQIWRGPGCRGPGKKGSTMLAHCCKALVAFFGARIRQSRGGRRSI